jgi:hypothetical protein
MYTPLLLQSLQGSAGSRSFVSSVLQLGYMSAYLLQVCA